VASGNKTSSKKEEAGKRPIGKGDHIFLVDGSGYLFRAYHALPPLTRKSDGLPTGAVSGFCNMLYKLLEDTKDEFDPSHLAVIFDASGKTFRNDIYPEYKANRPEPPEDLIPQFGLVRDAVRAFSVPCVEMMGYEADDLIATYARLAAEAGAKVTIVSSDKDLMQLVTDKVDMLDTMKSQRIYIEEVEEKFGVKPELVGDVLALMGDSVDNIPVFIEVEPFEHQNGAEYQKDKQDGGEKRDGETEDGGNIEDKPGTQHQQGPGKAEQETQKRIERTAFHAASQKSLKGFFVKGNGSAEVNVGQHHEDERLQQRHE
jgi:hypothetical protein